MFWEQIILRNDYRNDVIKSLSSIKDIGNDNGKVNTMKNFVSQIVDAPTNKACLEQRA